MLTILYELICKLIDIQIAQVGAILKFKSV